MASGSNQGMSFPSLAVIATGSTITVVCWKILMVHADLVSGIRLSLFTGSIGSTTKQPLGWPGWVSNTILENQNSSDFGEAPCQVLSTKAILPSVRLKSLLELFWSSLSNQRKIVKILGLPSHRDSMS